MATENMPPRTDRFIDRFISQERREEIFQKRIEIASTILLALATIATAWSGYQSARWGGEQTDHSVRAATAIVRVGKFANLAEQKNNLHISLFGQYAEAVSMDNLRFANSLLSRFPEPLKAATIAWEQTQPWTSSSAPATPFELPEYVLDETRQAEHWEQFSAAEAEAANEASEISDRYLLFTIIFASVLFFGGVSGKFGWQPLDLTVLVLGTIGFAIGLVILFTSPII